MEWKTKLNKIIEELDIGSIGKWLSYSLLIGIVAGLGATFFYFLMTLSSQFFLNYLGGYFPPLPAGETVDQVQVHKFSSWLFFFIPALGGLISGFIVYSLAPEAEGHGTDAVIDSFHRLKGVIRKRVPLVKAISSVITIGSGGSAGREGPIAQIGAGFGSYFASLLKLSEHDRRVMLVAGAGGGIGSIFRSPLGGALFATEVLYREPEFEFESIIPAIISSIVAYCTFCSFCGWGVLFDTPEYLFNHPVELIPYSILGIVCAFLGVVYIKIFYGFRDHFFKKLKIPNHFKPAIGGLMLGVLAFFLPHILGGGYGWVQLAIFGKMSIRLMLVLAIAKMFATAFTISSGGSGGVFAPSLFIGAMLGGAFGGICQLVFPGLVSQPTAFVLVGMGGFFAGAANVPIASVIMACEMTGSYGLLAPLLLVSTVSFLFTRRWSIYEKQVKSRVDSPAHFGEFAIDVLKDLKVKDVVGENKELLSIPEGMPLRKILRMIVDVHGSCFPVVNSEGKMTGMISVDDLRRIIFEKYMIGLIVAKDIATTTDIITVTRDEDLHSVMRKFTIKNIEELPIVNKEKSGKVDGILSRKDVIIAYNKRLGDILN